MGIKLLSVRTDTKKRFEDIQIMLNILNENEKVDRQLVLKSSLILMVYNVVEGTMSNLLTELFDFIVKNKLSIDRLPQRLQDTMYTYHLKEIGNSPKRLKQFSESDGITLSNISYLEINKYLKLFSGNLDSRSIKEISHKLGITLPDSIDEPSLLQVKNSRNKLAHGEKNFCNMCQDITLSEMKKLCEKVEVYLERVTSTYEDFLNSF
jgi:hypothetical protein